MHLIEFKEAKLRRFIPENIAECNRQQYLDISKLVLMYQMAEIDIKQFRVLALYNLLNMEASESEFAHEQEEKWQNIYIVSELINTFFEVTEDGRMHLIQNYIDNKVKSVSYKAHSFYGPKDGFLDITWKQLLDGIGEVQNFLNDGKIERLVKLFAMFYTKRNERYGKFDMGKRLKFFDQLDIRYIYGFYLLFLSFWRFLTTSSIISVDGKQIDLSVLFDQNDSEDKISIDLPELGLRSTTFQLAESGVFGAMEELEQTKAWDVLVNMYDMMVRNKKREAEMEAQKNNTDNSW